MQQALIAGLLITIFFCMLSFGNASSNSLVDVWKAFRWKRLKVVSEHFGHNEALVMKHASQYNIQVSFISADKYYEIIRVEEEGSLFVQSYYIFAGKSLFEEIRHCLLQFRRPYSIMVVTEDSVLEDLHMFMEKLDKPLGFYNVMHSKMHDEFRLFRLQTFIGGGSYVKDEWSVLPSGYYATSYDMQGHPVTSSTLTWRPWLILNENCQEHEITCRHSGVLSEMMDVMGKMYNFTWSVTPEPDGNWGVSPLNREDGLQTHDYVGVLGNIVNKKYDISISIWTFFHERTAFIDYTTAVTTTPRILMIDGSKTRTDFTIFLRPFTKESWMVIACFLIVTTIICLTIPKSCELLFDQVSVPGRIVTISIWMLFILINAYYGGALTMFFTSAPFEPFETLIEGLKNPSWELIMQEGYEEHILFWAKDGDKPFAEWGDKYKSSGLLFSSMKSLFEKLTQGRYFTMTEYPRAAGFLNDNIIPGFVPKVVAEKIQKHSMIIVTKNSPMTPMLNQGLARMRQSGLPDLILEHHMKRLPGVSEKSSDLRSIDAMVLGGNQLVSAFAAGAAIFGTVIAILIVECFIGNFLGETIRDKISNYGHHQKDKKAKGNVTNNEIPLTVTQT